MGETEPQLDISCHQMNLTLLGMDYITSKCWPKLSNENPQTIQAIDNAISCSLQTEAKALLLKIIPIQLIKHKD